MTPLRTIRSASQVDCDALGLVTVTASLGAFIGRIPEASLQLGWTPDESAQGWRKTLADLPADEFVLVAEIDDVVVGFVWAGPSKLADGEGEVKGLYVLPTAQGQGFGSLLVCVAAQRLQRAAMSSLIVGCIAENPSCGFYRHLGGSEAFRRPGAVDRYSTEEIVFRWPAISELLADAE